MQDGQFSSTPFEDLLRNSNFRSPNKPSLQAFNEIGTETDPVLVLENFQNKINSTPEAPLSAQSPVTFSPFQVDTTGRYNWQRIGADNEDLYGQGQSWGDKVINGTLKGLSLAGTTFLQGTVGLVAGLANILAGNGADSFYNNDFSNAIDSWNKKTENWLPNYYTKKERDAAWYEPANLFTANFLFDKFVKNLGFSLGAIYSGAAVTKALKMVPAINSLFTGEKAAATLAQIETKIGNVPALQRSSEMFNMLRQASDATIKAKRWGTAAERFVVGSLGAATEGGIEALQGLNEFRNTLIEEYRAQNGAAPMGEDLARINSYAENLGNSRFAMNMALLTATNYVMLPKILGSSYKTSKALANQEVNNVVKGADGMFATAFSSLPRAGKFLSRSKNVAGLFFSPTEGFEELSQYAAEKGVQDYYNKAYRGQGRDWAESIAEGYNEAINSDEGMEQFLIGALSGGIQQSGFISSRGFGKSGNIAERGFRGQGGQRGKATDAFVSALNNPKNQLRFKSEAWLKDMSDAAARGINLQIEGENFIRQGDVLEAKDNEMDYMHNYLAARIKHGRYDMVKDDIDRFTQEASTPEGLEELKRQNIANENDTAATFVQRIQNFARHADNINSLYQSLNITYGGRVDGNGDAVYTPEVIDKMVYAASKVSDYEQRVPELTQNLLSQGVVVAPVIESIITNNTIPETATKDALNQINNLTTLSEIKDNLKGDLRDVIELSKRRKFFLNEYENIKNSPNSYKQAPQIEREEKATIKQRNEEGKAVKAEVEIGKEYSVQSEPLFRTGNKIAVNPKMTILSKTLGGEYEVRMPDGSTRYIKPNNLKDFSLIESEEMPEELTKIVENTIFNTLVNEGMADGVTPESPLSDLVEFVNTLNNNVLVNKIQKAVRDATKDVAARLEAERLERLKLARDKALHDALFKAQSTLPEEPTDDADDTNDLSKADFEAVKKQDLVTYPLSTAFAVRPGTEGITSTDPEFENKPHLLREEAFLNNLAANTLTDSKGNLISENVRVLVVHYGNQESLNLNGLVEQRNPIRQGETPEAYKERLTNPKTGTILYLYVKKNGANWDVINETGKTIGTYSRFFNIDIPIDINQAVTSVARTSTSISEKSNNYTNKASLDAKAIEKAWEEKRAEMLSSTNVISVFGVKGISRGIKQITNTSDRNPVIPTLTSKKVADTQRVIFVSTTNEIFTPNSAINYKAGKPYFQIGDNVTFLNNRTLTEKEAQAVFLVMKELASRFEASTKEGNTQFDKQLINWLNSILYWHSPKEGQKVYNHQIYVNQGKLFISGVDTGIYFTADQLEKNKEPIISTFLRGNQAGRGTYHNISQGALTREEEYISYYTNDGTTLNTRTYPSYQAYLLENQVVTTNVRPQMTPTDSNIRGRYAIIDISLNVPKPEAVIIPTTNPVIPAADSGVQTGTLSLGDLTQQFSTPKPPAASANTPAPTGNLWEELLKQLEEGGFKADDTNPEAYSRVITEDAKNTSTDNWSVVQAWFQKNLPNVPIERVKHLIKMTGGGWAWGKFGVNGITLYENAKQGTGYHEAFEAVWALFTTPEEKESALQDLRKRTGTFFDVINERQQSYSSASHLQLKELLADEFAQFVQRDGKVQDRMKGQPWIIRVFKNLFDFIKGLFSNQANINELFNKINTGWYSTRPINIPSSTEDVYSRVAGLSNQVTKELMEDITSQLLNSFFGEQATLSLANLSDNKRINLNEYYSAIKPILIGKYMALAKKAGEEGDPTVAQMFAQLAVSVNRDWKDIVEMNTESLKIFNIVKKDTVEEEITGPAGEQLEYDEDEQLNDDPEQTFTTENRSHLEYQRDEFTLSGKKNASAGMKLLMSTIRDAYFPTDQEESASVIPKIEFKRSSIGGFKFLNYTKAFNQVANALVNTNKLENILSKLVDFSKQNAPIADLFRKLKGNTTDGTIPYDTLSYNEWRILLDFTKTFSKQSPPAFVYISDGNTAQFLPGNKQSGIQYVVNKFTYNVKSNKSVFLYRSSDRTYVVNKELFEKIPNVGSEDNVIKFINTLGFTTVEGNPITQPMLRKFKGREKFKDAVAQMYRQLRTQQPVFDTKNKALQLRGPINTIADGIVSMTKDDGVNTFLNLLSKPVQSVVLPSPLATFFNNFNSAATLEDLQREEKGLTEGFSRNSITLQPGGRFINTEGRRTAAEIQVGYFDGTKTPKNTRQSAKATLINRRLNSFNLNLRGWFIPITNGDKKTEWILSMGNPISFASISSGTYLDRMYTIFQNYLKTEMETAQTDDAKNLEAFSKDPRKKGSLRFFIDILPKNLVDEAHASIKALANPDEFISANAEAINKAVKIFVEREASKTRTELSQYGIISKVSGSEAFSINGVDEGFIHNHINEAGNNRFSEKQLADTLLYRSVNQIINNIEIHKLFLGDPAFMNDAAKRIPGAMGGVNQSFYGEQAFNVHFAPLLNRVDVHNTSTALMPTDYGYTVLRDEVSIAVYKDVIVNGATGPAYKNTNEADGASKMTLPAYRGMKTRHAEWTDEQETQYQYQMAFFRDRASKNFGYTYSSAQLQAHDEALLKKGQPQEGQFEITKPKGWGQNSDSNYKDNVYLKTSTQPLIPTAIQGTNDEKLLLKMLDEGVEIAAFSSAIKIGARTLQSFYNEKGEFNTTPYPKEGILMPTWKDLGIQVETQFSQGKTTVTFGSQMSTLAALNLLSGGVPTGFTQEQWSKMSEKERIAGSEAYKYVTENTERLVNLVRNGYTTLLDKLGIEETAGGYNITDYQLVINYLLEQTRDMDDNTRAALKVDAVTNSLKTPLEAIPTYTQLKAVLYSIVDKNIASPKVSGAGLVQMPSTGTESEARTALVGNSTYKFYTKEEPWIEVALPAWFRDKLVKWYTNRGLPIPTEEELLALVNDSDVLTGIGFRIPSQEMNSFEVFKVKRFLPHVMGNAVIVPSEITSKAGSDFDIDKLNTYLKNIFIDGKGQIKKVPSFNSEQEAIAHFDRAFEEKLDTKKKNLERDLKKAYFQQSKYQDFVLGLLSDKQVEKYADLLDEIASEFDDPADGEQYFIDLTENIGRKDKQLNDEEVQAALKADYIKRNVRKSLENAYFESLEKLIQLPENYERLIATNTSAYLEGIKNTLNKALFTDKEINALSINTGEKLPLSYLSVLSPNSLDEIRHNLITGKDGVGIAAAAQKSNSIMQRLPVTIDINRKQLLAHLDPLRVQLLGDGVIRFPHNTFDGKPTISATKTKKGQRWISDTISQYINGFVDIVKNTFIIEMGVNTKTAGTFLLMDRLGNDTEHTTYFMNQPIIRDYLRQLDRAGIGGIRSKGIIRDIIDEWGDETYQGKEQLPSAKKLLENIEYYKDKNRDMNNLSPIFIAEQAKIFREFLKYQEMASDLFTLMQGINWDTAHMSDPEQFLLKDAKYNKANNTIFTPASEILSKVFIGEVRTNLMKARDAIGGFITLEHPRVREVLDEIKNRMINPAFFPSVDDYSKMARRVNNSFINYIMQVKGSITPALLNSVLLNEVGSAAAYLAGAKRVTPKNSPIYPILQQFDVQREGNEANSVKAITFRKTGSDSYDRNTDIDNFRILKENSHTYELYKRLVSAALLQTGVNYTRNSFAHLIPNEDYAAVLSDIMKQLPEYTDLDVFLTMDAFVRNNWATNGVIPSVTLPRNLVVDRREDGGGLWTANFSMPRQLSNLPAGSIYNTIFYMGEYVKFQPKNTEGTWKYDPSHVTLFHGPTAYEKNDPRLNETYLYKLVRDPHGDPLTIVEGKYTKYIYRAINAWGQGEFAQENYDQFETNVHGDGVFPGSSKIANNTYYVDESVVNEENILKALGRTVENTVNLQDRNRLAQLWETYGPQILKKNPKATPEMLQNVVAQKGIDFLENYLKQCYS